MAYHLATMGSFILNTVPVLPRMKQHPEYENWAKDLVAFGEPESFAPLRPVLAGFAKNALSPWDYPLNEFLRDVAPFISYPTYVEASRSAEEAGDQSPCAAFLFSLIVMSGWARMLGDERLYGQEGSMPNPGWTIFPYICASLGARVGSLKGALRIIHHSYDILFAAKYHQDSDLVATLNRYRDLARTVQRQYRDAVRNLADDLRESCCAESRTFVPSSARSSGRLVSFHTADYTNRPPLSALFQHADFVGKW